MVRIFFFKFLFYKVYELFIYSRSQRNHKMTDLTVVAIIVIAI